MTAAQAGALDTEKREKDAIIAAKQKIIEDRRQAEKDEEERQKAAAIEALGIDAIGPRPAKEPGEFHQLVDATEHRVPGACFQTYGGILTLILHINDVPCCWSSCTAPLRSRRRAPLL